MAHTAGSPPVALGTSTKNSECGLIQRTREIVPSTRIAPPSAERSSTKYSESEWCAAATPASSVAAAATQQAIALFMIAPYAPLLGLGLLGAHAPFPDRARLAFVFAQLVVGPRREPLLAIQQERFRVD